MGTMLDSINDFVEQRNRVESNLDDIKAMLDHGYTIDEISSLFDIPVARLLYFLNL